jgi:cytidylate kinase
MFNVVTIAREYGSGGGEIGRRVAELLGWELVDRKILERVAALGHIDRAWAEEADEQSCGWWERVLRGFRFGGPEGYIGDFSETGVDRDALQQFTAKVIAEAGKTGQCVIVGRCAQCVLRNQPGVLHVLVWAPLPERLVRLKQMHPEEHDIPGLLQRMDAEHARYAQQYFGCSFCDRKLFHVCLNSTLGLELCARVIANAVTTAAREELKSQPHQAPAG